MTRLLTRWKAHVSDSAALTTELETQSLGTSHYTLTNDDTFVLQKLEMEQMVLDSEN